MARPRATTIDQENEIVRLVALGHRSPAQIFRHLQLHGFLDLDGESRVSEKTIARRIREYLPEDNSSIWCLADKNVDPDDASLVLDVLVWIQAETDGQFRISTEHAHWIVRIRKAVPSIPANWAFAMGWAYILTQARHKKSGTQEIESTLLDLTLGVEPWSGDRERRVWGKLVRSCATELGPIDQKIVTLLEGLTNESIVEHLERAPLEPKLTP